MKVWLGLLLLAGTARGAFEQTGIDPRSLSLGNCAALSSAGIGSPFLNPAGLCLLQTRQVHFSYGNQFGLSETSQEAVSFASPVDKFGFSVGFSNFGQASLYQEQEFTVSAGRKVYQALAVGLSLNYFSQNAAGYERENAFGVDFGLLWQKGKLALGTLAFNLNQPKLGRDKIVRSYNAGASYEILKEVSLLAGVYYDSDFKEEVQLGQETKVGQNLALRAGFQTEPNRYSLGAGFFWSKMQIDYAYINHPDLGGSHAVGILLKW